VQTLSFFAVNFVRRRFGRDAGLAADLLGERGRHARKIARKHLFYGLFRRILQHREEHSELDAVRMRFDFLRLARKLRGDARKQKRLAFGRTKFELEVRVRDDGLLEIFLHARSTAPIQRCELHLDARSVIVPPLDRFFGDDVRLISFCVDAQIDFERGSTLSRFRRDGDGFSGGELRVQTGGADADSLLPAAHFQSMEFRSVEELRKDFWNLRFDDARTVVLDHDAKTIFGELDDLDDEVGQNSRLFASVERVVDSFFDGREQSLCRIVEAEEMPVLREELTHRDVALACAHRLGGRAARGLRGPLDCGFRFNGLFRFLFRRNRFRLFFRGFRFCGLCRLLHLLLF